MLRFLSESSHTFDKFYFNSEHVTYNEIIEFLAKKKKIDSSKKTDHITLYYSDKPNQEISGGIIEHGSQIIVVRKPPESAVKQLHRNDDVSTADVIELTYNPKQLRLDK